jgi:hypothetical protein
MAKRTKKPAPVALSDPKGHAAAVEYSLQSQRLLESKYFDKAAEALRKGDKEAFIKICKEAGISDWLAELLWDALSQIVPGW